VQADGRRDLQNPLPFFRNTGDASDPRSKLPADQNNRLVVKYEEDEHRQSFFAEEE